MTSLSCPVCDNNVPSEQFVLHTMIEHPQFFAVWASFSLPTLAPRLHNIFTEDEMELDEDDPYPYTYEELLELCDSIGYHTVGVSDIDKVSQACDTPTDAHWKCTICLEDSNNVQMCRCIKKCNHVFCGTCIETWLKQNKKCPICKQEVEAENESTGSLIDELD